MTTVSVHEAKTHLSRLINRVLAGEEITVARGKQPVVKLVPATPLIKPRRNGGWLAATLAPHTDVRDDGFWEALPHDHLGL
jgi:prevent-host-death family protein